jgi:hypothetical protein
MSIVLKPLFETYESFIDQDFSVSTSALVCVRDYLAAFSTSLDAQRGYLVVRSFLRVFG